MEALKDETTLRERKRDRENQGVQIERCWIHEDTRTHYLDHGPIDPDASADTTWVRSEPLITIEFLNSEPQIMSRIKEGCCKELIWGLFVTQHK